MVLKMGCFRTKNPGERDFGSKDGSLQNQNPREGIFGFKDGLLQNQKSPGGNFGSKDGLLPNRNPQERGFLVLKTVCSKAKNPGMVFLF